MKRGSLSVALVRCAESECLEESIKSWMYILQNE
jgi:hypothetical protein